MSQLHANCVGIGDYALLLRGASGSGKSSISLRLINAGGFLIADDRTNLVARDGRLIATAPPPIAGMCEVRGIGIVRGLPRHSEGDVRVVIDLVADAALVERMPHGTSEEICGIKLPRWTLWASDPALEARIRVALALAIGELRLES
jgi:serine kinase of HPr protein (carbohydrate metabolism regulator)